MSPIRPGSVVKQEVPEGLHSFCGQPMKASKSELLDFPAERPVPARGRPEAARSASLLEEGLRAVKGEKNDGRPGLISDSFLGLGSILPLWLF
jgi:hypothetical protein